MAVSEKAAASSVDEHAAEHNSQAAAVAEGAQWSANSSAAALSHFYRHMSSSPYLQRPSMPTPPRSASMATDAAPSLQAARGPIAVAGDNPAAAECAFGDTPNFVLAGAAPSFDSQSGASPVPFALRPAGPAQPLSILNAARDADDPSATKQSPAGASSGANAMFLVDGACDRSRAGANANGCDHFCTIGARKEGGAQTTQI